jgi:starch synthase
MAENVIVFHPGRQHAVVAAGAYFKSGMLAAFCTSLRFDREMAPFTWLAWLGPSLDQRLTAYLSRFRIVELPREKVLRYGLLEYVERVARALRSPGFADWINAYGNARFCRSSVRIIDRLVPAAVVGFNNAAKEIFEHARSNGILCVLEQTVAHPAEYNVIYAEHRRKYPGYFASAKPPMPPALIKRQNAELDLADLVIVGSPYAKASLERNGVKGDKIRIIEYGHGFKLDDSHVPARRDKRGRIEFVFVGAVDVRKGCHLLIEAMRCLTDLPVHLTMAGPVYLPLQHLRDRLPSNVTLTGKLSGDEVLRLLLGADCFVFPSLFEGSAIVLREAQFAKIPIIQTERAGVGAVPGVSGLYVEPDVADLAEKIALFAADDALRSRLVANARATPARSWEDYQNELAGEVRSAIEARHRRPPT